MLAYLWNLVGLAVFSNIVVGEIVSNNLLPFSNMWDRPIHAVAFALLWTDWQRLDRRLDFFWHIL